MFWQIWHYDTHYDSRGIRNMFSMTNIRIWYRVSHSLWLQYFCLPPVRKIEKKINFSHLWCVPKWSFGQRGINTTFPRLGYLKDFVYKFSFHALEMIYEVLEVCQFWVESLNHFNLFRPQFLNRLIENFSNFRKLEEKVKYFSLLSMWLVNDWSEACWPDKLISIIVLLLQLLQSISPGKGRILL